MDISVDDLQRAIDRLDDASRARLLQKIEERDSRQTMRFSQAQECAANALITALGPLATVKLDVLAKRKGKAVVADKLDLANAFVDRACSRKPSLVQRRMILIACFESLIEMMQGWEFKKDGIVRTMPVTVWNVLVHMDKLPSAVDADFPGYADARLLDRIALQAA
jgi:hypothetical protein